MKDELFGNLIKIHQKLSTMETPTREDTKPLLVDASDIVQQFNLAKLPGGKEELNLNEDDLFKLKTIISNIWDDVEFKNVVSWHKPDITHKIG